MKQKTLQALIDLGLSYYGDFVSTLKPETAAQLSAILGQLYLKQISEQRAKELSQAIVGTYVPIERVLSFMELSPEPIPSQNGENGSLIEKKKSRQWTNYEDLRLLGGIYRHGIENWTSISMFVGNGRTRSQCSQRWLRGLDPSISKRQWSKEEEERLVNLVDTYGNKSWTKISMKLQNRSDVQCRYRYKQLLKCGIVANNHNSSLDSEKGSHQSPTSPGIPSISQILPPIPTSRPSFLNISEMMSPPKLENNSSKESTPLVEETHSGHSEVPETKPAESEIRIYTLAAPKFDGRLYSVY